MQEAPENVPEGETPQTIHACAYEDLVDFIKPGDRVETVGIYRAQGIRVQAGMRTLKNIYRTYIDVIGYVKTDKKRYDVNTEEDDRQNVQMRNQDENQQDEEENNDGDDDDMGQLSGKDAGFTEKQIA